MKKIFTLIAVALTALGVNAQTHFEANPEGLETVPANTVLTDNEFFKATTVYEALGGANNYTYANGAAFTHQFQLRVANNPSADFPYGEQQTDCTPVIIDAKQNITFTAHVRTGNNKEVCMYEVATSSKLTSTNEFLEDGSNNLWSWTWTLEAGKQYVITEKGGTGRLSGFTAAVATAGGDTGSGDNTGGEGTGTGEAKAWNFKVTTTANEVFAADATNWEDNKADGSRWVYIPETDNAPLMVGGVELEETKGLLFKAGTNKIRIDRNSRLGLNGSNIVVTIPALKAGQIVTIKSQSANADDAPNRQLAPSNLTVTEGFCLGLENAEITNVGTVTADGDVTITTVGGINVYSIEVSSSSTVGINNVTTSTIDVNAPVYNISGQQVGKNYKGIVIQNGKKFIKK